MLPRRISAGALRPSLALLAAAATCALAASSAATGYGTIWGHLSDERARYGALTEEQREREPITSIPLDVNVLEFYRGRLRPDDRVYFHVRESGFGAFVDLRGAVTAAGRFWLLPAVEVEELDAATVVVSWDRDPAELGLAFSEQHQAGQNLLFVSRIAR